MLLSARKRSLLLGAAVLLGAAGACKKDAAATTTPVPEAPATGTVLAEPVAPVEQEAPTSAASLLRYLPRDSSVVSGMNWKQARKSESVRSFEQDLVNQIPAFSKLKASCGLDVVTDVQNFAFALGEDPENPDTVVAAVQGNFTRSLVEDCIRKDGGKVEGNLYDGSTHVYWPAADTIVLSSGVHSEKLALIPSASAWDNAQLMALVDEVDLNAEMWAAATIPPKVAASMSSMGAVPTGAHLTIRLASGLVASLGMEFATKEDADAMAAMIAMGINMAKGQPGMNGILDNVSSGVVDQTVVVVADLNAEKLGLVRGMLQGIF